MISMRAPLFVSLIGVLSSTAFADCAVLDPETAERLFAKAAENVFYKGIFVGISISAFVANLWFLLSQPKRWFLILLLGPFLALVVFAFFIAEVMTYCGHAGISASYYLVLALALLLLLVLQLIWKPRRIVSLSIK